MKEKTAKDVAKKKTESTRALFMYAMCRVLSHQISLRDCRH